MLVIRHRDLINGIYRLKLSFVTYQQQVSSFFPHNNLLWGCGINGWVTKTFKGYMNF